MYLDFYLCIMFKFFNMFCLQNEQHLSINDLIKDIFAIGKYVLYCYHQVPQYNTSNLASFMTSYLHIKSICNPNIGCT